MTEITTLVDELYEAAQAYYQKAGDTHLTDEEFDAKIEKLKELSEDPAHADQFAPGSKAFLLLEGDPSLGTTPDSDDLITHDTPMLSLGKAKDAAELTAFLNRMKTAGAKDFTLQAKLDGFALSAHYENGALSRLATRGTGTVGENITYLLDDSNVTIDGLPRTSVTTETFEVRGELFFTNDQFNQVNEARYQQTGERFKHSRNAVVGLMKKAKAGVLYPVEFTFSAFSVTTLEKSSDSTDAQNLDELIGDEFLTANALTRKVGPELKLTGFDTVEDVCTAVTEFGIARPGFDIPTDGVVIKPTNEAEMHKKLGFTSHHPSSQIAYKYPGETGQATVLNLVITVGKTGRVTPTAEITPVLVDGAMIRNASCHNYAWVYAKDLTIGATVLVTRANDIIPQITTVLRHEDNATLPAIPTHCPHCKTLLTSSEKDSTKPPKTLTCENILCPSREYFALKTAVGKSFLNIDGLAEATLKSLNDTSRILNIADLYTLTVEELTDATCGYTSTGKPRKLGAKRAANIIDHIEKSKTLPLWRILASLNINRLGFNTAKILAAKYTTIEAVQNATLKELTELERFGALKAEKIRTGLTQRAELIQTLKDRGVQFTPHEEAKTNTEHEISGKSFSISGDVPAPFANRNAWVEWLESNGASFHSSPKDTTDYIIAEADSNSSKAQKARKLGVEFMTSEGFTQKYSTN